jgi:non-homologous end joining protein Ku
VVLVIDDTARCQRRAQEALAVIREAMKRKNMVGLGRVVISRRERVATER